MMDEDYSRERCLLTDIYYFNKNYKRKSKKERRNSIPTSDLFKVPEKRMKGISDQEESESDYSFPISHSQNNEEESVDSESNKSPQLLVVV